MPDVAARIKFERERVQAEMEQKYARAFRLSLFDEVVRHASAMPRPVLSANDARYVSFLSRGICEHKLKTEYPIFKGMLADIEARFLEKSAAIVIRPDELTSESSHRVECHVIFASARDIFEWIGITPDMNRRAFLINDRSDVRAGATECIKIMGSMQCSHDDESAPIHIFVGRSSASIPSGSE